MAGTKGIKDINIQGIKDSTDIFLLADNFPLNRMSKFCTMLSLLFL